MKIIKSGIRLPSVILDIVTSHSFLVITAAGNLVILGSAYALFLLENNTNDSINTFLDAVWWAFATATTVGYGDIIPVTVAGKVLGILLMLMGTALFAMYTALFAQSIFEDELLRFRLKLKKPKNPSNKPANKNDQIIEELKKQKELLERRIKDLRQSDQ